MIRSCKPSFLAVVLLSAAACGGSSSSEAPASHYAGGLAGTSGFSGSFTFDIAGADAFLDTGPAGVVDATGAWTRGGAQVSLFGTYTGSTKLVSLSASRDSLTYNFVNDPVSAPATRVTGGAWNGTTSQGAWVALKVGPQVTVSVLCGSGSGASLGNLALVLGSDGAASMALQFQTIPVTMLMTRTGDALSGSLFGYTFSGTVSGTGQNASGTVTNGTTSATWTVGVSGC